MRLTLRKFVLWSPARLAIEIEKGLRIGNLSRTYFLKRGSMRDCDFVEKIKLLMTIFDVSYIPLFVRYTDIYLPSWMFELIISSKIVSEYIIFTNAYNLLAWVSKIDNIKICLSKGFTPEIAWPNAYPLDRIRELKPWFPASSVYRYYPSDEMLAIMRIPDEKYYIFDDFCAVKKIISCDGISDIWWPQNTSFEDFEWSLIDQVLNEGWIIVLKLLDYMMIIGINDLVEDIAKHIIYRGKSYMLFDEKFKYGVSNKNYYTDCMLGENIDATIAKDITSSPFQYERWLKAIDLIGMAV